MIKKILVGIVIVVVVIIILIAGLLWFMSVQPNVPTQYTKQVQTGGNIESRYLTTGQYAVDNYRIKAEEPIKEYRIYAPKDNNATKLSLVISLNGTGVAASKYTAWFEHMASYGFIVIGTEDPSTGKAESLDTTIAYLLQENQNKESKLYQRIDFDKLGVIGHSQGGAGVFSASTKREYKDYIKTVIALSPTQEEMAHQFGWDYDLTQLTVPTLMLAGDTGEFETQTVLPLEKMKVMFDKTPSSFKVLARRVGADHGQMLYATDGYVTAWFMWQLQGDDTAKSAFIGEQAEILNNKMYQDVKITVGE